MATRGIIGGRTVGDPFADHQRFPGSPGRVIAAVFRNMISRNREPANCVPVPTDPIYHGSTFPFQDFGFHSMASRVNRPDLIAASRRNVPLVTNNVRRGA
jgi:hypothetical protein